jgi:hypothetical protein
MTKYRAATIAPTLRWKAKPTFWDARLVLPLDTGA